MKKKYFLIAFDGGSSIHRKNPLAAIKAFKIAFPSKNSSPNLIIKTHSLNADNGLNEIVNEVGNDNRITIINNPLSNDEMRSLISCSDYLVSLHRAEGFGRIIAEAMLLRKPVIVSNYSGNLDFCNSENALLVSGKLIQPRVGEYFLCDESDYYEWFDASIEDAAEKMRLCYTDEDGNKMRINRAFETIKDRYNKRNLIDFINQRLSKVNI